MRVLHEVEHSISGESWTQAADPGRSMKRTTAGAGEQRMRLEYF